VYHTEVIYVSHDTYRCTFGVIDEQQTSKQVRGASDNGQMEQWFADGAYALVGTYGGLQGTNGHTAIILITADSEITPVRKNIIRVSITHAHMCVCVHTNMYKYV
jgi:hypothetical protein